jgi:hypothetical protein
MLVDGAARQFVDEIAQEQLATADSQVPDDVDDGH